MEGPKNANFTTEDKRMLQELVTKVREMRPHLSAVERIVADHAQVLENVLMDIKRINEGLKNLKRWSSDHSIVSLQCSSRLSPKSTTHTLDSLERPWVLAAAEDGDAEILLRYIQDGVDVEQRNQDGDTALHLAACGGHELCVIVLLGAGASVAAQGSKQRTPLHFAAECGHYGIVKRLMQANARVDAEDADGRTPIHLAARHGHTLVIEELLEGGGSIDCRDCIQRTPLMWAAHNGNEDAVALLMQHDAALHEQDNKGNTALLLAAKKGRWAIVETLAHDRPLSANGPCRNIPISKNIPRTREITPPNLKRKLNERSKNSINVPLLLAAENGELNTIRELLSKETYSDEYLGLAIALASDVNVVRVIDETIPGVLQGTIGEDALCRAARYGNKVILQTLLDCGVDVNGRNWYKNTALSYASFYGHLECVKILLRNGVNMNLGGKGGRTPLLEAADQGKEAVVRLLLEAGADPTILDENGRCCKDVARSEAVRKLVTEFSNNSAQGLVRDVQYG